MSCVHVRVRVLDERVMQDEFEQRFEVGVELVDQPRAVVQPDPSQ